MEIIIRNNGKYVNIDVKIDNACLALGLHTIKEAGDFLEILKVAAQDMENTIERAKQYIN